MNIYTVADILLFLSLVGLIVGLIKPKLFHRLTNDTHRRKKIGLVFGLGILIALIMLVANTPATTSDNKNTTNTATPASIIKAAVGKDLAGTNDLNNKQFRNVDIVPQAGGGYGIFVGYNADEVGSADSQQTIFTMDMTKLYKTIYSDTHQDVRTASVSAYFAGTDKYGNKSDKLVYKTILNTDVSSKINWSTDETTLELKLPSLWTVTI